MTQIFFVLYQVGVDLQTYDIIGATFEVHKIAAMVSSRATGEEEFKPQISQMTQIFFVLYQVGVDLQTYDIIGATFEVQDCRDGLVKSHRRRRN